MQTSAERSAELRLTVVC